MKFESVPLYSILEENSENKIVLPNFQRGYVWDDDKQRKLIKKIKEELEQLAY